MSAYATKHRRCRPFYLTAKGRRRILRDHCTGVVAYFTQGRKAAGGIAYSSQASEQTGRCGYATQRHEQTGRVWLRYSPVRANRQKCLSHADRLGGRRTCAGRAKPKRDPSAPWTGSLDDGRLSATAGGQGGVKAARCTALRAGCGSPQTEKSRRRGRLRYEAQALSRILLGGGRPQAGHCATSGFASASAAPSRRLPRCCATRRYRR